VIATIGLIGEIGPESTIDYYLLFIELYRMRKPEGSNSPLLIKSIDMNRMTTLVADSTGKYSTVKGSNWSLPESQSRKKSTLPTCPNWSMVSIVTRSGAGFSKSPMD
jgi:hypothetical protein